MRPGRALSAAEIAALVGGELIGPGEARLAGVASLEEAGPGELSFLASATYLPYFHATSAGAVLVAPGFRELSTGPATRIVVDDPRSALKRVIDVLVPTPPLDWAVDPSAALGRGARWEGRVSIGRGAVIGAGVSMGAGCRIGDFARIGVGAVLGTACRLEAHAEVAEGARLGDRVVLRCGARVGVSGFAFVRGDHGAFEPIVPVAGCRLGDDVEIGAHATVAAGSIRDTVIGAGTKIDTLVHVGHNARIGARCLLLAQVGVAGSTTIGDDVMIAGQAGLADGLRVGDRARIAAQSGVIGDVAPGATVSGYPARDHRAVLRQATALSRLAPLVAQLERAAAREVDRA